MTCLNRRTLPAAALLISLATAQTCYYPSGKISTDIPCDPTAAESSCCGSDSFCLADGLCYGNGLVTRGSCTDQTWGSEVCASVCTDVETSGVVALIPCTSYTTSNTFACGVNNTDCSTNSNTFVLSDDPGLVLRPSQIAQLVGTAVSTAAPTDFANSDAGTFTTTALVGVAVGVAAPLLIALLIMYILLRREKRRFSKPRLMYKLPDEVTQDDFTFTPPPPLRTTSAFSSNRSSQTTNGTAATATSTIASRRLSKNTSNSALSSPLAVAPKSFMERYETMKKQSQAQVVSREVAVGSPRHELESPTKEVLRYELSESRMSH